MTNTLTNNTPGIWVGCLACYNDGRLTPASPDGDTTLLHHGGWADAEYWADAEPVCPINASHEEFEVMDTDHFYGVKVYRISTAVFYANLIVQVSEWAAENNITEAVAWEYINNELGGIDYFNAAMVEVQHVDSLADWAHDYVESCYVVGELFDLLDPYVDWEKIGRDLLSDRGGWFRETGWTTGVIITS